MIEKYPVAVQHPAVTGAPGANGGAVVAGEFAGIYFKQQDPVQIARGFGVRLVHAVFIYRRRHSEEGYLVITPGFQFNRPLVNAAAIGRVFRPGHFGEAMNLVFQDMGALGVQGIGAPGI